MEKVIVIGVVWVILGLLALGYIAGRSYSMKNGFLFNHWKLLVLLDSLIDALFIAYFLESICRFLPNNPFADTTLLSATGLGLRVFFFVVMLPINRALVLKLKSAT